MSGGTHWAISAYIVCHDIKVAGYANGVVAWPEEPAGSVLEDMIAVFAIKLLAAHGEPSPELARYDVISVTVTPTTEPQP